MSKGHEYNKRARAALKRQTLCKHGLRVCSECVNISDAARRMSDVINLFISSNGIWELRTKWLAFRLETGENDGALYDTKKQAVQHVTDEKYFAFFCFRNAMAGANPRDCQLWLEVHRMAYEHGNKLYDPDDIAGGKDMIMSTTGYDRMRGTAQEMHPDLLKVWRESDG